MLGLEFIIIDVGPDLELERSRGKRPAVDCGLAAARLGDPSRSSGRRAP
jgi:hypothetical protein